MRTEILSNGAKFIEDGSSSDVVIFLPGHTGVCDTPYHKVAQNALVPDLTSIILYESARDRDLLENWDHQKEMDSTTWGNAFYNKGFDDEVDEVARFIENVAQRYDSVSLSGYSFGGAVAVALMGRKELGIKRVMLTAPQIGLHEVARLQDLPVLYGGFPSARQFANLAGGFTGEVRLFHGEVDHIVPVSCSKLIYDSLRTDKKQLVVVEGMGHGFYVNPFGLSLYEQLTRAFSFGDFQSGSFFAKREK